MAVIYEAISAILLFWHAAWHKVVGDASWLATNWSWVLGIIFLVITVRAILFPIFVKQIKSQRAMQALQPKVKALQEKHKGDRETLQQELMKLYREEKANPLMGCLPMFLQVPVFLGLFHVLRHLKPTMPEHLRTLYGWTAGQFESASHAKLFGAPIAASFRSSSHELSLLGASGTTVKIVAAILIATMIVTTYFTSRQMILKTGWAEDPQQRMVQKLMLYGVPFSLLISGYMFPIGVVIYWVTQNIFSLGQQMWVLRKFPPLTPNGTPAPQKAKADAKGAKSGAKDGSATKAVDSRALAPKVGAKPVNPKKGGAAKR
ncbi:membrane protein insertase YidC [Planosporangium flavigriseum]|nr:membrane protein insertase YidC [Planosporangium flavigriseum]NJC64471.1 membrane protein insertase YidC [Planosporangium flavigriseum]